MDNQEFDKIFSDKLRQEQAFDFRETDWEEVAGRIGSKTKFRRFFWWFFALALITVSLSSAYLYFKLGINQSINQQLIEQIDDLEEQYQEKAIKADTVYLKDTIYQALPPGKQKIKTQSGRKVISSGNKHLVEKSEPLLVLEVLDSVGSSYENLSREASVEPFTKIALKAVNLHYEEEEERYYLEDRKFLKARKRWQDRLKIGLTTAFGITKTPATDSLAFLQGLDKKRATFDLGIQLEWALGYKIRALAGVNFSYIRFEIPGGLEDYGGYYGNTDFMENLNISQSAIHYRLGLKYVHQDYKKWTAYAGLLLNAQSNQNWTTRIQYLPDFMDGRLEKSSIRDAAFRINALEPFIGLEGQISNRFSWQLETWYQYHFQQREDQIFTLTGLRTSFVYHF